MSGLRFLICALALTAAAWHTPTSDSLSAAAVSSGPMILTVLQEPGDIPLARAPLFGPRASLSGDPIAVDLVILNTGVLPFDVSFRAVPDGNADGLRWETRTSTGRIVSGGAMDGQEAPILTRVMPGERVPLTLSMNAFGTFDDVRVRYQFTATQSPPAAPWTIAR
jgi:hypothetical protein